jgi:hypothetical protein
MVRSAFIRILLFTSELFAAAFFTVAACGHDG